MASPWAKGITSTGLLPGRAWGSSRTTRQQAVLPECRIHESSRLLLHRRCERRPGQVRPCQNIKDELPPLPANWICQARQPRLSAHWSALDWRYYIYIYYRWVEMVDAEIGRLYSALMSSRFADNTVVIFAADHGDGLGFHGNISKGYMEEEAWRVPTIIVASLSDKREEGRAGMKRTFPLVSIYPQRYATTRPFRCCRR